MDNPSALSANVKEYFQRPNAITRGLTSTAPSVYKKEFEFLFPALRGKRILDVGAGKGRISIPLALNGCDVTAVDLSVEGLAELERNAKAQGTTVRIMKGDAENLNLPDKTMDALFCIETLVHVPNIPKALAEFNRVLKDEGLLAVSVTLPFNLVAWPKLTLREFFVEPYYGSPIYQNYVRKLLGRKERTSRDIKANEILKLLDSSGFAPLYRFTELSRFFLVISKKKIVNHAVGHGRTCPYLQLYPDARQITCNVQNCGKQVPQNHEHLDSTGECVCPRHAR